MSRSKVELNLPDTEQQKFYDYFPGVALSHVMGELLTWFIKSYEDENASLEEVLSRLE